MIVSVAFAATRGGSAASSSRGVIEEGTTARIDDSASSIEKEVRLRSMRLGLENVGRGFAAARGWGPDDDDDARASHSSSGATNRGLNGDHAGITTLSSAPEAKSLAAGQGSSRAVPGVERANAGNPPASITARSGAAAPCDGDDDARFGASAGRGSGIWRGRRDARGGFLRGYRRPDRVRLRHPARPPARRGERRSGGHERAPSSGARARGRGPRVRTKFQNTVGEAEERDCATKRRRARARAHQTVDASRRTVRRARA